MHPTRVYHQVTALWRLDDEQRKLTLLGSGFDRIPVDAAWHYTMWANHLSDDKMYLEQFREVTVIQPTWMMDRRRFDDLGGYLEAPPPIANAEDTTTLSPPAAAAAAANDVDDFSVSEWLQNLQDDANKKKTRENDGSSCWRLVHPAYETVATLRMAEDLRFFHEHLLFRGRLQRCPFPLVTYRHRVGQSQCSQTSRKLLLYLRVAALESCVLRLDPLWHSGFAVWGAGRDGKDFVKALSPDLRNRVYCMVDVDDNKIACGYYHVANAKIDNAGSTKKNGAGWKIPILHFSLLVKDAKVRNEMYHSWKFGDDNAERETLMKTTTASFGRIQKGRKSDLSKSESDTDNPTEHDKDDSFIRSYEDQPSVCKRPRRSDSNGKKMDPGATSVELSLLPNLPVVVCVAMYRTNGALERNVAAIGRTEGTDLWHFN